MDSPHCESDAPLAFAQIRCRTKEGKFLELMAGGSDTAHVKYQIKVIDEFST